MQSRVDRINQINDTADTVMGGLESTNIGVIFWMFSLRVTLRFLEMHARFFMFPLAAALAGGRAVAAWIRAKNNNYEGNLLAKAIIRTAAAIAIAIAVAGGLVASIIFGAISPLIFSVTMLAETTWNLGSIVYYAGKAAGTDPRAVDDKGRNLKRHYKEQAKESAFGTVIGMLATAAVIGVMVFAKIPMTTFGLLAGAAGAILAVIKLSAEKPERRDGYEALSTTDSPEHSDSDDYDEENQNGPKNSVRLETKSSVTDVYLQRAFNTNTTAPQPTTSSPIKTSAVDQAVMSSPQPKPVVVTKVETPAYTDPTSDNRVFNEKLRHQYSVNLGSDDESRVYTRARAETEVGKKPKQNIMRFELEDNSMANRMSTYGIHPKPGRVTQVTPEKVESNAGKAFNPRSST